MDYYDIIVVGGGHAGAEAALAASKIGCNVLLLTSNLDTICQMSCNPAIGGLAKGHIVREIDALGGEMGVNTDHTGIQFRMLNTKKGPSVHAPRAQCDKKAYQYRMKWILERQPNLHIKQGMVDEILEFCGRVVGVITKTGTKYSTNSVIVTTGTFLRGVIHTGKSRVASGRSGDPASDSLSGSLIKHGFEIGRMKTGTPPRVSRRSLDFTKFINQLGDETPSFFSFTTPKEFHVEQIPCYITQTTAKTKDIILSNISESPLYSGQIQGVGPRYCPSIEDKFVKFKEKDAHQIFLEPEGRFTDEFYVNGASSSMPEEIQCQVIKSIKGMENAEIMRMGYAVEYDYSMPHQLKQTLETKLIENLYFAGQINGTSGYEEAAAQGIVAGINAALKLNKKSPLVLTRDTSYIGVMIDDLITRGTDEPYRMFTSRAEYRLQLRQDNADQRLTPIGREIGLIDNDRWCNFLEKRKKIESEIERLRKTKSDGISLAEILKRPEVNYSSIPNPASHLPMDVQEQVEIQLKYEGYIARDLEHIEKYRRQESKKIPNNLDYSKIASLRFESRQKLSKFRPETIGQASRISGVTPADIAVLLVWLKKNGDSHSTSFCFS